MYRNSIVRKQFLMYLVTISVCVLLMGLMFSVIYTRHYMSETKRELVEQGAKVSNAIDHVTQKRLCTRHCRTRHAFRRCKPSISRRHDHQHHQQGA